MKYSQPLGIVACLLLIANCFFPWSYIADLHLTISGIDGGDNLGRPGLFNIVLCSVMIVFFLVPRLWAKRANVIIGALNIAWSLRNYLLAGGCFGGICPEKRIGLYLLLLLAFVIEIMTFLPPIKITPKE